MKGIIIKHPTGMTHSAFDILIKKEFEHEDYFQKLKEGCYNVECNYVKKFLELNPDYVFIGSEDNGHIPQFNWIDDEIYNAKENGLKLINIFDINEIKVI